MPKIRYIGNKERKEDNVAGTGTIWNGNGDVQEVSDKAAALLLPHSGVWELADGNASAAVVATNKLADEPPKSRNEMSEADAKPPLANIDSMDKAGLIEYAQRHFNHAFHPNTGEAKMRQTIIGLMNRG